MPLTLNSNLIHNLFILPLFSEPSYDLSVESLPIETNKMHYIELSNEGLKAHINPHKESIDFWTNIERKVLQLSEKFEIKKHEEL